MRIRYLAALAITAGAPLGCGSSAGSGDVGGGSLTASGCQSQMAVGDQMTIRAQWTSPGAAKYTLFWLDGASNFTINSIFDETLSHAQSNDVSGEYDLPGSTASGQKKTVVAVVTANKAGNNTINVSVWGSGDFNSGPPDNAASVTCDVAINPY